MKDEYLFNFRSDCVVNSDMSLLKREVTLNYVFTSAVSFRHENEREAKIITRDLGPGRNLLPKLFVAENSYLYLYEQIAY